MIEVHINGCMCFHQKTDVLSMSGDADLLNILYRIDLLKTCGVDAYVCITGVMSKANNLIAKY